MWLLGGRWGGLSAQGGVKDDGKTVRFRQTDARNRKDFQTKVKAADLEGETTKIHGRKFSQEEVREKKSHYGFPPHR